MDNDFHALADPALLEALRRSAMRPTSRFAFDRLTSLATRVLRVPIGLTTLIDGDRQLFISSIGLDQAIVDSGIAREEGLCHSMQETRQPLAISDLRDCAKGSCSTLVLGQGIVAYAGFPLQTADGAVIGSFCVMDRRPRVWTEDELGIITDLGAAVMVEINLWVDLHFSTRRPPPGPSPGTEGALAPDPSGARVEEGRLGERVQALVRSNADLEQFAYLTAHDLQEPLRMITGFLSLAQRRAANLDAGTADMIGKASEGALRMQRLIQDMLAYARIDTQPMATEAVDAEAALDDALRILGARIASSRAAIERGPLPQVVCAPVQLVQVFQNLLSNALKYRGAEPPRIRVGARIADGMVEIAVADNGIGMDPALAPHAFDLFRRLPAPEGPRGSGLGLAICKRIVERHGGSIGVESEPGRGSTFRFTLPGTRRC
jgi:signal transduction histidine kinase